MTSLSRVSGGGGGGGGWWDKLPERWAFTVVGDGISEIILNGKYTVSYPFKFELL